MQRSAFSAGPNSTTRRVTRHETEGYSPAQPFNVLPLSEHEESSKTLPFSSFPVAAAGLEPANVFTGSDVVTEESGHTGGPVDWNLCLSAVIDAWPILSEAVKLSVVRIVREAVH